MVTRNAPCQCTRADSVAGCPRHDPYYKECTCRGYVPEDPCGHGDTSEGCPKHDPNYVPDEGVSACEGHEYVTSILQALSRISAWEDTIIDRYRSELNRIDNDVWNMVSDWEAD